MTRRCGALLLAALLSLSALAVAGQNWPASSAIKIYRQPDPEFLGSQRIEVRQGETNVSLTLRHADRQSRIDFPGQVLAGAVIDGADGRQALVLNLLAEGREQVLLIGSLALIRHLEELARARDLTASVSEDQDTRFGLFQIDLDGWERLRTKETQ